TARAAHLREAIHEAEELLRARLPGGLADGRAPQRGGAEAAVVEAVPHETDELLGTARDPDQGGVAADLGKVAAHDRQTERQVFLELDRVAAADPVVVAPRHQRHVETRAVARDLVVRAVAEP